MLRHRDNYGEALSTILERTLRTAHQVGFTRDVIRSKWSNIPELLPVVLREGVSIRTIHHVHACLYPTRPAAADEHRQLNFRQLNDEINRLANALRNRFDVTRNTPVALAMKNRVEYLVAWMALSRLGASTIHASWRQTAEELSYQLQDSRATVLIGDTSVADAVDDLQRDSLDDDIVVIGVDGDFADHCYADVVDRADSGFPFGDDESAGSQNIVYTSGTTGRPKGAVRDLAGYGLVEFFRILERLPVRTGDRHLIVSPMYHSGGQVFSLMQAALGATVYILPQFDAEETLRTLHDEAINSIFLVPTMLRRILELDDALFDEYTTPALRGIFCGAAPFPKPLRERAIEQFGASVIHDFYGATELGWITLINGEEMLDKPGSVGRPIAGQQLRIVDDDGRPVQPGETGVIYVRNDHIMSGYLGNQDATDEITDNGWMTVDDLGYIDDDGYLYIAGRQRDMVISGGVNIYPAEIEEVLDGHQTVREAAVIGVDDEEWGQRLVAVVAVDGEPDEAALESHCREHLSDYKVPRSWRFVDALPRNPTGKVLKRNLEQQFEAAGD